MYVRIDSMNIWKTRKLQYQNIWTNDLEDGMTTLVMTLDLFVKRNDIHATTSRPLLFRVAYIGTSAVQYAIIAILVITILESLVLHEYNKILSLLVVYLSHFWSAIMLGVISFIFVHWFRSTRSISILIYAAVFGVSIFLILITLPLLTEHFRSQPGLIYRRDYTSLITGIIVPSRDIAFIYGLGNYVLPVMITSTWVLRRIQRGVSAYL